MKILPVKNLTKTEDWCSKIIGPRTYWLHNKLGGAGWRIINRGSGWELELQDEKQALLAILKFSDQK